MGVVAQQCWVRLHIAWGSLELRHVSLPHQRVVLLLKLCSVKKIKREWFFVIPNTFSYGKIIQMSVEVFPLKTSIAASCLPSKKTQGPFFASEKLLLVRVAPQLEIYPWTLLLLRNAPHLVGKAPIEETRTEKREGAGKKAREILKRFIRLRS